MRLFQICVICFLLIFPATSSFSSQAVDSQSPWNENYDFIYEIPPIRFHYDHGILAGSYAPGHETTEVSFNDVSRYLGHICLCGVGGYRICQIAVDMIGEGDSLLEKGEFSLISSRDHTVSDVIAYVLGCSRRSNPQENQYFIDRNIDTPKREYHYFIGYHPTKKAVHIVYRKHLLIGNEQMDRLWRIECTYDVNPGSVSEDDLKLYQDTMVDMVKGVLLDQREGLFEAEMIDYNDLVSRKNKLQTSAP